MTTEAEAPRPDDGSRTYEIRVRGHLPLDWSEWFAGLTMTHDPAGDTLLRGQLADQSALHGVLTRIRDLGIPLVAVTPGDEDR